MNINKVKIVEVEKFNSLCTFCSNCNTKPKPDNDPYSVYKTPSTVHVTPPVINNFPVALAVHSAAELWSIPQWNMPYSPYCPERTLLFSVVAGDCLS